MVSGGTFDIENVVASTGDNCNITISGGTFEKAVPDLEQYLIRPKSFRFSPTALLSL